MSFLLLLLLLFNTRGFFAKSCQLKSFQQGAGTGAKAASRSREL
jgi:hypothetical protein